MQTYIYLVCMVAHHMYIYFVLIYVLIVLDVANL